MLESMIEKCVKCVNAFNAFDAVNNAFNYSMRAPGYRGATAELEPGWECGSESVCQVQ
jgi:hypothetical protein